MSNIISQSEASRIAKISRQGLNNLKKRGTYSFFTPDGKVDTSSQSWKSYLHERSSSDFPKQEKSPKQESKVDIEPQPVTVDDKKTEINVSSETDKQANRLTGGYNVNNFTPENIADIKRLTEIERLKLEMEVRNGELIEIEQLYYIIESINQSITSNFLDLPRRASERLCSKLDRVGWEKEVESIINPFVEIGIRDVKIKCKKALKIKYDK